MVSFGSIKFQSRHRQLDVGSDIEVVIEREILGHQRDVSPPRWQPIDASSFDLDGSAIRGLESGDDRKQGALSGAGFAEQGDPLASAQ